MKSVSKAYKEAMNSYIRNRGYVTISVGAVNQEAQASASIDTDALYFGNSYVFGNNQYDTVYATMEEDFVRADGSLLFAPEEDDIVVPTDTGYIAEDILGAVVISIPSPHEIIGLTLKFVEDCYPTRFRVASETESYVFTNDSSDFQTLKYFGETETLTITPLEMVGGDQRLRLTNVLLGVGLNYTNDDITSVDYSEEVSGIAEYVPTYSLNVSIIDENNMYNPDDDTSIINALEIGQPVSMSMGIEIEDGNPDSIEWVKVCTLKLATWDSTRTTMTFTASDVFETALNSDYTAGYRIYTRTAYDEAEDILEACGLEIDDCVLDEYLRNVTLTNPMPECTAKEALQILANACRCKLYQDENGRVIIRANFANVIDPEDITVTSVNGAGWSDVSHILYDPETAYADMSIDYIRADGTFKFLPENGTYNEKTGFISSGVANADGEFTSVPAITLKLDAGHVYYGMGLKFLSAPDSFVVTTRYNSVTQESFTVSDVTDDFSFMHEFSVFDEITFSFPTAEAGQRIHLRQISFGALSDYRLEQKDMLDYIKSTKEEATMDLAVGIYSYHTEEEEIVEDDPEYYSVEIGTRGDHKKLDNPLVADEYHADELGEWIANYYANNINYEVSYRGEPRLNAGDIIYLDTDVLNNLQVDIESLTLTFNGAFGGSLKMRKALSLM